MVTIRDILKLDNCVDQINVAIYDSETGWIFGMYDIGTAGKVRRYANFLYSTDSCDVYKDGIGTGYRLVRINRPINQAVIGGGGWRNLTAYGALFENVPDEILNLKVDNFGPDNAERHHFNCHGYNFRCYAPEWSGIPGEGEEFAIAEDEETESDEV